MQVYLKGNHFNQIQQESSQANQILPEILKSLNLTKRETEIFFYCLQGKKNKEIAQMLFISDKTVKKHLEKIYRKFGVSSRHAAVASILERMGIIFL